MQIRYNFHSNLSKEECIKRFSDKTNPKNLYTPNCAMGKLKGDNFYFDILFKSGFINSLSKISKRFKGVFQSTENGTNISGSLTSSGKNNFIIILLVILALILLIPMIIKDNINFYQVIFVLAILIGYYFAIPRSKGRENIDFIKDTFEAQEIV